MELQERILFTGNMKITELFPSMQVIGRMTEACLLNATSFATSFVTPISPQYYYAALHTVERHTEQFTTSHFSGDLDQGCSAENKHSRIY